MIDREFTQSELCLATGVPPKSIQNWLNRGLIVMGENIKGGGSPGRHRQYSFSALMTVAVASRFMRVGVGADKALKNALFVCELSDGGAADWADSKQPSLVPGVPYHYTFGTTYAVSQADRVAAVLVKKGNTFEAAMESANISMSDALVAVDLSDLFVGVCRKLDIDPYAALNQVYGIHCEADLDGLEAGNSEEVDA